MLVAQNKSAKGVLFGIKGEIYKVRILLLAYVVQQV